MKLRHAIRKHRDAEENARCWHNDLSLYSVLEEEVVPGKMRGPEKILLQNCLRYIRRQQCSKPDCKKKNASAKPLFPT